MTDFSLYEVDLDTERPNPYDNTKVFRGDAPRTAFTKYNDMLDVLHGVVRHVGALAPTPTIPYMLWLDTSVSPPVERERNADNTAWVSGYDSIAFKNNGVVSVSNSANSLYLGGGATAPAETHLQAVSLLRFWTGGVDRGRFSAVGNLSLGGGFTSAARFMLSGGAMPAADGGNTSTLHFSTGVAGRRANNGTAVAFIGSYSNTSAVEIGAGQTGATVVLSGAAATVPNQLKVFTNNLERVTVTADGNFGLGTTTPNYAPYGANTNVLSIKGIGTYGALEIVTDGALANNASLGELSFVNALASTAKQSAAIVAFQDGVSTATPGGRLVFYTRLDAGAITAGMCIAGNGNVGVGPRTTPNYPLHVNKADTSAYVQITSTTTGHTSTDGLLIGHNSGGEAMWLNRENTATIWQNNNTEVMRLSASGLLGIGTNNPQRGLHLAGGVGSAVPAVRIERSAVRIFGFEVDNTGNFVINDNTDGVNRLTITPGGSILSGGGSIGYGAGAGGTVVQATSKATGVTLNKPSGRITVHNASLAASTVVSFTFTNSSIAAYDVICVTNASATAAGAYLITVDTVVAGSCRITIRNMTAGALAENLGLNFVVHRGSNA